MAVRKQNGSGQGQPSGQRLNKNKNHASHQESEKVRAKDAAKARTDNYI